MKRIFIILLITVLFSSCSLLYQLISKAPVDGNIYVMDWEKEAVYKLDSLYNTELFFNTGAAPSDLIIEGDEFIVSNSGLGGTPSIDIYTMEGTKKESFIPADNSSPAGLFADGEHIYAALWGSSEVIVLDRETLDEVKRLDVPSAYSVFLMEGKLYVGTSTYSGDPSKYIYTFDIENWDRDSIETGNNPAFLGSDGGRIFVSCQGNAASLTTGSIHRIENGEIVKSREFDSFPGRIECSDEGLLFVTNAFYSDTVLESNVIALDGEDLSIESTYDMPSASDSEQYNNKIIVGTNSGEIYVIELSALTEFISADTDMNLKTGKIVVK